MGTALLGRLSQFWSINLTELNATASYLKRIDRKFLLTEKKFLEILKDLSADFRILEIDGKRVFNYDNVYMDTQNYDFYMQHENGEDNRTKVRTRHYVDSWDLAFFEYKQKENWVTKKFRYQFPASEHGSMTKGKKRFFDGVWQSLYESKAPSISPAIQTRYKRLTLVSKDNNERLTIDFQIAIKDLRHTHAKTIHLDNLVIIESKSLAKSCKSIEIIEGHGIQKAKACSKYSLWVVYSWLTEKWSHFEKTMQDIQAIRLDVNNEKRKNTIQKAERLSHGFKKTTLEKVSQSV